ncbi:WGR domain-containing protein [Aminobacter sp. HY435]|uniref:WGR domain-containing protein n=1 Tax=Aminobacter sp. HY435 TaxID=2970917 RepID=UPI0022B9CF76|nr:WGR domain-containing protein [Aminobacter sp. HY435]
MRTPSPPLHLRRFDPGRNMARFYCLSVENSLFGEVALVREWGRIGTRGKRRLDLFGDTAKAEVAMAKLAAAKMRRGYRAIG